MRPAFRRGWEGEGKPNRRPGAGQRARSGRHSGAAILLWEREGKALGVPGQSNDGAGRLPRSPRTKPAGFPSPRAPQPRPPRPARRRRPPGGGQHAPAGRCAPAQPRQRDAVQTDRGRPARREARAPAGQLKDTAPLGARSAGQSASLIIPAHFFAFPIFTRRAKTTGLVREANRAGCRQATPFTVDQA